MKTRNVSLVLLIAWSALAVVGSASAQGGVAHAAPAANAGAAQVYVYRYRQFVGSGLEPSVYCDDMQLARMDNGRYFVAAVESGPHTFRANDKQSGILIDLKPGEQYYLRVELAPGLLKGHGRLVLVPKEQGEFEVAKLKPLGPDKIKDPVRVASSGTPR
jgi:hypothetical protein